MKLYVASHSGNLEQVRDAMTLIRSQGHEITCDWTIHVEALNKGCLNANSQEICREDVQGVRDADALVYLHTEERSAGAWFEVGLAVGLGIPVLAVVGDEWDARLQLMDKFIFLNCETLPSCDFLISRWLRYALVDLENRVNERREIGL